MLLLGLCVVLGLGHRAAIAAPGDGFVQSVISGLAHHSGALLVGYALALAGASASGSGSRDGLRAPRITRTGPGRPRRTW